MFFRICIQHTRLVWLKKFIKNDVKPQSITSFSITIYIPYILIQNLCNIYTKKGFPLTSHPKVSSAFVKQQFTSVVIINPTCLISQSLSKLRLNVIRVFELTNKANETSGICQTRMNYATIFRCLRSYIITSCYVAIGLPLNHRWRDGTRSYSLIRHRPNLFLMQRWGRVLFIDESRLILYR